MLWVVKFAKVTKTTVEEKPYHNLTLDILSTFVGLQLVKLYAFNMIPC